MMEPTKGKNAAARGTRMSVLNANAAPLLDSLRTGADGCCGVIANTHPKLYAWLYEQNDGPGMHSDRHELSVYLSAVSVVEARAYPVCAKYDPQQCGLPITTYARGESDLQEANRAEVVALLRTLRRIEERLRL